MNRVASEQEMVQIANQKMTVCMKRPPSYSDSFFFLPDYINILEESKTKEQSIQKPLLQVPESPKHPPIQPPTHSAKIIWITRTLSFGIHITLIGIFETLFYFLFVSKSEDEGIQLTINNYIQGVLTQCSSWNTNTTIYINDFLSLLINTTQVINQGQSSSIERKSYNSKLEVQAWLYVVSLFIVISSLAGFSNCSKFPIPWKRIILENLCMVTLLGLYEFFFFKTIIYNYRSLTFEELNLNIVQQLQGSCGILK